MTDEEIYEQWKKLDKLKICKGKYEIALYQYGNGRCCLQILNIEEQEPECSATVNLVDDEIPLNEFFVRYETKNFCQDVFQAFIDEGIAHPTGRDVSAGYVEKYAEIWKLGKKEEEEVGAKDI